MLENYSKPRILNFPRIKDARGNLTFLQNHQHFPFEIKRTFCTYDIPGGEIRGGHAYRTQHEVIISLSGSFDVIVKYPDEAEQKFSLNRGYFGLYLPPMTWRYMENFSTNAFSLHLSSSLYSEDDYLRSFEDFKKIF